MALDEIPRSLYSVALTQLINLLNGSNLTTRATSKAAASFFKVVIVGFEVAGFSKRYI